MMDMPPKSEPIMIIRKQHDCEDYRGIVSIPSATWEEMQEHMDRLDITLNKFVNIAIKKYLKELYYEQEETEKYTAFSDLQLSPSSYIGKPTWATDNHDDKK